MVFNHDLYQFVQSTVSRKKEDLQEIVELETGISKAYEDSSSRLFTFKLFTIHTPKVDILPVVSHYNLYFLYHCTIVVSFLIFFSPH